MSTKAEFDIEIALIRKIQDKLDTQSTPFTDSESLLLREMVDRHIAILTSEWRQERLVEVIDILFPRYDGRRPDADKPIRHPEKAWWWNGATITESRDTQEDNIRVDLRSYVGGNEYDNLEEFEVLKEWLEADDMEAKLHKHCQQLTRTVNIKSANQRLREAERNAAQAQEDLARARAQTGGNNG